MRVMIIGGGIGGLCLAQGLHWAGIDITVYERTEARTDWLQGYRIHINPNGSRALHHCLPPALWDRFLDTVSVETGGFGLTTEHLDDLLRFGQEEIMPPSAPEDRHYGASRVILREVLLSGLDGIVKHGKEFTHYETAPGGVTAHFADGTTATADILIGADGANSRVRQQLLPHAHRADTGVVAVAGKHPLEGARLPRKLTHDVNLVIPKDRGSLFTAIWHPAHGDGGYILWGYADAALPVDSLSGRDLKNLVLDRTIGWAPALRGLICGSDPETVNAIRLRSASPVKPWPTGRVTLLGDAIHNMTPMAGVGANTALRDADLLRRKLIEGSSLHDYEREMLDYGFAAVKRSLRNAQQAGSHNRFGRAAFRTTLRVVNALPPIRRRMAARLGK